MKIGLIQYSPVWENPKETIKIIEALITSVDLSDVSLLIFPEMSLTGFTMSSKIFAEEIDGVSFTYFMQLSRRLKKHIFAGIIEKDEKDVYNSLIHFDNNGLIRVVYRKIHPFSFAKEDKNFKAGNETIITKVNNVTFGLSICYDLRFPELYRQYGKKRADVLINIANWPVARIQHWDILLQARAIENQCYMIGVNRIGDDPFLEYPGHSAGVNPMGEILNLNFAESISIIEIDVEKVKTLRETLPFLDDMKMIK
ncbi:MAG: hydrolase [Bacteroidetes bacterium]|nr:hydrolase [Bacteroidota bacterium]MBU1115493.1 hydrolase [Bacteroidota bacterium]MBU1798170.1 hydrolase [Bacteroidota bacterium]